MLNLAIYALPAAVTLFLSGWMGLIALIPVPSEIKAFLSFCCGALAIWSMFQISQAERKTLRSIRDPLAYKTVDRIHLIEYSYGTAVFVFAASFIWPVADWMVIVCQLSAAICILTFVVVRNALDVINLLDKHASSDQDFGCSNVFRLFLAAAFHLWSALAPLLPSSGWSWFALTIAAIGLVYASSFITPKPVMSTPTTPAP